MLYQVRMPTASGSRSIIYTSSATSSTATTSTAAITPYCFCGVLLWSNRSCLLLPTCAIISQKLHRVHIKLFLCLCSPNPTGEWYPVLTMDNKRARVLSTSACRLDTWCVKHRKDHVYIWLNYYQVESSRSISSYEWHHQSNGKDGPSGEN